MLLWKFCCDTVIIGWKEKLKLYFELTHTLKHWNNQSFVTTNFHDDKVILDKGKIWNTTFHHYFKSASYIISQVIYICTISAVSNIPELSQTHMKHERRNINMAIIQWNF